MKIWHQEYTEKKKYIYIYIYIATNAIMVIVCRIFFKHEDLLELNPIRCISRECLQTLLF